MKADSDHISDSKVKRHEVQLALEISDIIDELNSLNRLFEAQKDVLDTAVKILTDRNGQTNKDRYQDLRKKLSVIITQDVGGYINQVKRMTADALRTKNSVSLKSVPSLREVLYIKLCVQSD